MMMIQENSFYYLLTNCLVTWHLPVRLDSMLKAIQLPTGITNLAASLTNVDRDTLTLEIDMENHFIKDRITIKSEI